MTVLSRVNQTVERWLTAPERNASGRLGLYRILYALFYLTYLPAMHATELASIPTSEWKPVLSMLWLNHPPSLTVMQVAQFGLVVGLGLLLIGWLVRPATFLVLLTGLLIVSTRFSFGKVDHANTFLMIYIPAIMLFYGWGKTYSVDALLRQRQGSSPVDVHDDSWRYGWPIKVVLWLLCILFGTGGLLKLLNAWLVDFETIPKLMYGYNLQPDPNPLNPVIAVTPLLYLPLHFMALGFETLFPLAAINRTWRTFFVSSAILFHLFNLLFLHINFVAMIITYAIFGDWQWIYDRLKQPGQRFGLWITQQRTSTVLGSGLVFVAFIVIVWHAASTAINLYFWQDTPSYLAVYWWIAVPVALYGVITSGLKLLQTIPAWFRRDSSTANQPTEHQSQV
ncbi:MAG: hypothetical protein K8L99_04400 [Anaerolineae bacterium]|nr:hypothetical protein [Anaerolineae bacterium]